MPASQDFKLAHKEIDQILKRAQVRPLAVGVHNDRQLLQFCYTSEVADSALKIPRRSGITWRTAPCVRGWRWWRWLGRASPVTRCIGHRFWQQLKGQPGRI
ncbi:bifunctional aspartokinase/homoserine dehydrogenase II] [Escherichia coli]|uniref:Bifunctional aspartokinase/homoserine dehydrogenase II] n=1 Tax=Escherichia coli TaxID=562 RepID=A0A376WBX8_ECOLX|nr:bifunctional aspartokinase/homoserine dehydrogenase II] [Escherichia coli]